MSRHDAIARAERHLDCGAFQGSLRAVLNPTASRVSTHASDLKSYVEKVLIPAFHAMGFETSIGTNDLAPGPFLLATRMEDPSAPTSAVWPWRRRNRTGRALERRSSPWQLTERDGRWYGRGTADNKGQHSINMAALQAVLATRGSSGSIASS